MAVVELDFYEPDGTTLIGTLDDSELIECEIRPALMELGALRIVVSRHLAAASSALLAKGNIVKVTYPLIDADPISVFVLKDDVSQLIDKDEQGGEHLKVTGPGGLWILQHARLREEVYAPGQPARGDWDEDISWNWRNRFYGSILVRAIEEGQNQPGTPLSAISIDFDRDVDSDGVPWYQIAEDFSVPIGTDVLTVADRLADGGDLFLVMTPDMVLHAYQTYGRDLTGAFAADNVRFQKGTNILTEVNRKTKLDRVTHLITRDMDHVYRTFVSPDPFDQAVYGFLEIDWTNDPDQVEKTALTTLAASDTAAESYTLEITPGITPAAGEYLPGPEGTSGHFWPGDLATLHTGTAEHDLNAASVRVVAVSIVLDTASDDATDTKEARSLHIVPELVVGTPRPAFSGVGNSPGATGVGCPCPKPAQPNSPGQPASCALSREQMTEKPTINGDAEDNTNPGTRWTGDGPISFLTAPDPQEGTTFFRRGGAGFLNYEWQGETWEAGVPYVIKFWARIDQPGGNLVNWEFGHLATSDKTSELSAAQVPQDWTEYCIAWTPASTHTSGVLFGLASASGTVNLDVDDLQAYIGGPGIVHQGLVDLVGTSPRYKRADDTEHYHLDRDPLTSDNLAAGFRPNTLWINSDSGALFLLTDAVAGTWLPVGAGAQTASDLTTRYEPHVDYLGTVVLDGNGDPVMVEVAN